MPVSDKDYALKMFELGQKAAIDVRKAYIKGVGDAYIAGPENALKLLTRLEQEDKRLDAEYEATKRPADNAGD